MDNVKVIEAALRLVDAQNPKERIRIYAIAIRSVLKMQPENEARREVLYQSILEAVDAVENKWAPDGNRIEQKELIELFAFEFNRQFADENQPLDSGVSEQPANTTSEHDSPPIHVEKIAPAPKTEDKKFNRLISIPAGSTLKAIIGLVLLIVIVGSAYLFMTRDETAKSTSDAIATSNSELEKQDSELSSTLEIKLPEDVSQLSRSLGSYRPIEQVGPKLVFEKDTVLYLKEEIAIDLDKSYFLKFDFSLPDDNFAASDIRMRIGFVTLDKNNKVQKESPGPHRYFVHFGKLNFDKVKQINGSFSLSGIISGVGNETMSSFRNGTVAAKIVFDLGFKGPAIPIQLDRIELLTI